MNEVINFSALSSSFSMFIWGLIIAKAKSGYSAAVSKDPQTVKSAWTNILCLLTLVGIATYAQIKFDNQA